MPVFPQTFFPFVSGHLMSFSFFTAWHGCYFLTCDDLTLEMNVFAGLKAGILCAGIMMVVFFEIFLAVFLALFLTIKLPNPLRYTLFPFTIESFRLSIKASTVF